MMGTIYIPIWVIPAIFVVLIALWWAWDDRHKLARGWKRNMARHPRTGKRFWRLRFGLWLRRV